MPKSFKKFRDEWDDEWDSGDEDFRSKNNKMRDRRDMRRKKVNEKLSTFDESDE
jgi:hypothetical protein